MSENEVSKNHIIDISTELLNEYNGDTKKITSHLIAIRADIGLGSINYFFGSKENLITECIQRIINRILTGFAPDISDLATTDGLSDQTRLLSWANQTFGFLFEHQAIAKSQLSAICKIIPQLAIPHTHKRGVPLQSEIIKRKGLKNYLYLFWFLPYRRLSLQETLQKN